MHEIITLQFGQRANYLATHFWNLQESYFTYSQAEPTYINHDVHFRAGYGADGTETYTPRTVIYDLKGGFGTLRKYNALYELQQESEPPKSLWDGSSSQQRQLAIEPIRYQKHLEQGLTTYQLRADEIRYWSDFNRVYYHPRSIVQLNEYELNSQIMPFEKWETGGDLFKDLDREVDLLDRDLRPFAEECDQMAGIQIMSSVDDAWGGFGASYIDGIRDEYPKSSVWVWALEETQAIARPKDILRTVNAAYSLQNIAPQASAFMRLASIPAQVPSWINLAPLTEWTKSALSCCALETMTLPTRTFDDGGRTMRFGEMESFLNTNDRQRIFELGMTDSIEKAAANSVDFTPQRMNQAPKTRNETFAALHVSRGSDTSLQDVDEHARERDENARRLELSAQPGFSLLDSFPEGLLASTRKAPRTLKLHTSLSTTSRTKTLLKALVQSTMRYVSVESREALSNDLAVMGEAYASGWDSGSDSAFDD